MADNTPAPGTPEWYRDALLKDLNARSESTALYDEYYEGEQRLAFATSKFRKAFGDLFKEFADNWCDLVVDAVDERLDVEGFRFGEGDDRATADKGAWNIWQRNQMDAFSQQGHLESLIYGQASVLVWVGSDDKAVITVEHPTQMIVWTDPGNPTKRVAALKAWDDGSDTLATLYLPHGIFKWERKATTTSGKATPWAQRVVSGEDWPLKNPLGVVPVVPLANRPRLLRSGVSEIKKVVPVQDAVNKLVADMMVASEYQAFRQRWATGLELPTLFDEDGEPLPEEKQMAQVWQHAIDRLWTSEDTDTKFGEFSATDLAPFTIGIEMLVQHIASQTRTPPHYFYLSGQFPSGESIKSAETGLVAKVLRKERFFGEAWEEVVRLAFAVEGDKGKAADYRAETIWADAESRTESEHVDATVKKQTLGVPVAQLWEDLGYSQTQIDRFRGMLQAEQADQTGLALALANALDGAPVAAAQSGEIGSAGATQSGGV